jgi:hypothetical protein
MEGRLLIVMIMMMMKKKKKKKKLCNARPATVTASNRIDGRLEGSICRQRLSACDVRCVTQDT